MGTDASCFQFLKDAGDHIHDISELRTLGGPLYGSGARDSDPDAQYTLQASRTDTQVTCSSHAGCMAPRS